MSENESLLVGMRIVFQRVIGEPLTGMVVDKIREQNRTLYVVQLDADQSFSIVSPYELSRRAK